MQFNRFSYQSKKVLATLSGGNTAGEIGNVSVPACLALLDDHHLLHGLPQLYFRPARFKPDLILAAT
jgi:hypothetical protein